MKELFPKIIVFKSKFVICKGKRNHVSQLRHLEVRDVTELDDEAVYQQISTMPMI